MPYYKNIYENIKTSIMNGSLKSGQVLPSSRALAGELRVARNTVLAAFAHLEAEGFIESRHGSGIYVRKIPLNDVKFKIQKQPGSKPAPEKKESVNRKIFSFRPGGTDTRHFPFNEFSRLTSRIYRSSSIDLSYVSSGGYRPLQDAVASYLRLKRGVVCTPEQVVVTNGSQEAIYLCGLFFLKNSQQVFIENPVYNGARKIFSFLGADMNYIDVDRDGMKVEEIPRSTGGLVYVTPSHQFPLGHTMSIGRRLQLLEKAGRQNLMILEDDYDSDFRYNGDPISSLQGYDKNGNVVYIGSFSKVLFPGIRLGYAVVPHKHLPQFLAQKKIINQDPPVMNQAVVAEFISSGRFYKHLHKMHTLYYHRKLYLEKRLQETLSGILDVEECQSGLHLVAGFRQKADKKKLEEKFTRYGIETSFLSGHYHGKPGREGLILGFAALNENEIENGIGILQKVFL